MTRVDLFTTIHKGVRAVLFDITIAAARVELALNQDVDVLEENINHALDLIEEHEGVEHAAILPVLRLVDPHLATTTEHATEDLTAACHEVRRAARAITFASPLERGAPSRTLLQALNDLTLKCLGHLHHEETVVNAVLWGALGDPDLLALQSKMAEHIGAERCKEWRTILSAVLSEAERAELVRSCPLLSRYVEPAG